MKILRKSNDFLWKQQNTLNIFSEQQKEETREMVPMPLPSHSACIFQVWQMFQMSDYATRYTQRRDA